MFPLSKDVSHLIKLGYRPIPCKGKRPIHAGWPTKQVPPEDWHKSWNIGILCGEGVYGADFDFYDENVSIEIQQSFIDRFGYPPIREGQAPKVLMVYRGEPGQKKLRRAWRAPDGTVHAFELLGAGQQFIAFGIHPDTNKKYKWEQGEPNIKDLKTWELIALDFDEVSEWMAEISVPSDWVETTRPGSPRSSKPSPKPDKEDEEDFEDAGDFEGVIDKNPHRKTDQKEVERLLKSLDPNMENDEWVRIGMALRNWDQDAGLAVWEEWSKAGDTWQEGETAKRWPSFAGSTVTMGTLVYKARDAGYKPKAHIGTAGFLHDRFLYVTQENTYFDTRTRELLKPEVLNRVYRANYPGDKRGAAAANTFDSAPLWDNKTGHGKRVVKGCGWLPIDDAVIELHGEKFANTFRGMPLEPVEGDVEKWLDLMRFIYGEHADLVLDHMAFSIQW